MLSLDAGFKKDAKAKADKKTAATDRKRKAAEDAGEGEEGLVVSCGSAHDVVIVPEDEIEARVVRAGAITRASERRGKAIVGCRVRVYWPEEDACFDGTVRGFDGCAHAVEYDDGDAFDELFGGEDTPHWRVLP